MTEHIPLCKRSSGGGVGGYMMTNVFFLTLTSLAFQRHNGDILTMASVKHLSHRRFVVSFQLDSVQRSDQDLYRCVTQSPRGSGVSNFAELVVKGKTSIFSIFYGLLLVGLSFPGGIFSPYSSSILV